jgi:hypothetical protein
MLPAADPGLHATSTQRVEEVPVEVSSRRAVDRHDRSAMKRRVRDNMSDFVPNSEMSKEL